MYRTLFYVNIYGSYKLSKTVRFFGPPCIFIYVKHLHAAAHYSRHECPSSKYTCTLTVRLYADSFPEKLQ